MIKIIKIPEDRKNVLKSCIKDLEKMTHTKIKVENNLAEIDGEALNVWKTKDVIIAIGRGFSPMNSFQILEDGKSLEVINLKKLLKTKRNIQRIKSRIIGCDGKSRKKIEELTNSKISVYEKTVSIISDAENMPKIKKGIEMIINGVRHVKVYKYLEGD